MRAREMPVCETGSAEPGEPPARALRELAIAIVISIGTIAFAPLLHVANPILAIAVESLVSLAIVVAVPAHAPAVAIFVLFFQNLFVSVLSPLVSSPPELDF